MMERNSAGASAESSVRPVQRFDSGDEYEPYVGRWSRIVARDFVSGLGVAPAARWLEVGCGTGALTAALLETGRAARVTACEPSESFLAHARRALDDPRVSFVHGELAAVPVPLERFDACVSGLVLNFIPDPRAALDGMIARVCAGGTIAAYVWDYAEGMRMMRIFWDAAVALDPGAQALDEAVRFPMCRPEPLRALWRDAGLRGVTTRRLEVPTRFRDFDEFWRPFLGGQGPAPSYVMNLEPAAREALTDEVRRRLPLAADGGIALMAVAWEVKGLC
jgi:SAM-dependent methyltransferase